MFWPREWDNGRRNYGAGYYYFHFVSRAAGYSPKVRQEDTICVTHRSEVHTLVIFYVMVYFMTHPDAATTPFNVFDPK